MAVWRNADNHVLVLISGFTNDRNYGHDVSKRGGANLWFGLHRLPQNGSSVVGAGDGACQRMMVRAPSTRAR